jgi:uncharacterized protein YndB with AHSA1/START domain
VTLLAVAERQVGAPPDVVFDAWLDPASLERWMAPYPATVLAADVDPIVGGTFRIVMAVGDDLFDHRGTYLEIDRPHRLAFTWISPATHEQESLVTVTFTPADSATETIVRIVHERLPDEPARGAHEAGWSSILGRLADVLATPNP